MLPDLLRRQPAPGGDGQGQQAALSVQPSPALGRHPVGQVAARRIAFGQ